MQVHTFTIDLHRFHSCTRRVGRKSPERGKCRDCVRRFGLLERYPQIFRSPRRFRILVRYAARNPLGFLSQFAQQVSLIQIDGYRQNSRIL